MAPSNQVTLNPTGKSQIGSSAEIPGQGVGNIMLSDPTAAHKCTCPWMSSFHPLGGKFPDEFTSSLWLVFQEFSWFDPLLLVCTSGSSLREAVLTGLGAGSKKQGSSSKIPNPRKEFNQEFKNRCDASRAARGQGLRSPSSSDGTISESPTQGDLGVKDAANFQKDVARV